MGRLNGKLLGLGGYLSSRRPTSLVRHQVRSRADFAALAVIFGSIETEMASALPSLTTLLYGSVSLGVFGLAPMVRRHVESGRLEAIEFGVTSLIRAFQAAARREPFVLSRARPVAYQAFVQDQITDLTAIHPVAPDLALIHVPYGSSRQHLAWGYGVGPDLVLAAASAKVQVSYDLEVERPPQLANLFVIPSHLITSMEHRPMGAYPTACWPLYGVYAPFYIEHVRRSGNGHDQDWVDLLHAPDSQVVKATLVTSHLQRVIGFDPAPSSEVKVHRQWLREWIANL